MSGSISKNDQSFTLRYRNGRPFTYTYTRHAPWSDTQHATRALFGATTYFAYLILSLDNAAASLYPLMRKAQTQPATSPTIANATEPIATTSNTTPTTISNSTTPTTPHADTAPTNSSTPKTYNRLSGFVASLLRPILLQDEDLRLQVLNAYTAYRTLKAQNTPNTLQDLPALKASHLPLAQTLLSYLLSCFPSHPLPSSK